ncbi:uncharacterized protein J5F26_008844 [Ciconia maguari]
MRTHLYLLLLAAGISAAPQMSSMAELLTLLQQMWQSVTKDLQPFWPPCLDHKVSETNARYRFVEEHRRAQCMAALGMGQGKQGCEMRGKCDTERKNARIFIEKLMTFIRRASKNARV